VTGDLVWCKLCYSREPAPFKTTPGTATLPYFRAFKIYSEGLSPIQFRFLARRCSNTCVPGPLGVAGSRTPAHEQPQERFPCKRFSQQERESQLQADLRFRTQRRPSVLSDRRMIPHRKSAAVEPTIRRPSSRPIRLNFKESRIFPAAPAEPKTNSETFATYHSDSRAEEAAPLKP
jgi:hypothetical protein